MSNPRQQQATGSVCMRVSDLTVVLADSGAAIVKGISFELKAGRIFALVGESGSGKTTVARIVTGLLPANAGRITFTGETLSPDLASRDRDCLRRLQMIYQMPLHIHHVTNGDHGEI